MNILILGGTGAMGLHLIDLLKQDHTLYVTSRSKHDNLTNVVYYMGNAHDMSFLSKLLKDSTYDVIVDFMSYTTEEFKERVDLLLQSTSHYIFLSSARVYARSDNLISEDSPRLLDVCNDFDYLKTDEYALRKAREEDILFKHKLKNWTIVRPYITYSDIRLQLGVYEKEQWLYRALNGKPIVFSEDVASKYTTLTFGRDVSAAISQIIGNQQAFGEAFHITGPHTILWKDVLSLYAAELSSILNKEVKIVYTKNAVIPKESEFQYKYDRLYNRCFDNSKIDKVISKSINYLEPEVGLKKCLREFIEEDAPFRAINWKHEGMLDRAAKVRTRLSDISGLKSKIAYCLFRYFPF